MKIPEILDLLYSLPCTKIALVAPNRQEAQLLQHRFELSGLIPNCTCMNQSITFDEYTIEFLTPFESMSSDATYKIIEFAENIPEPDIAEITPDLCCGEIT